MSNIENDGVYIVPVKWSMYSTVEVEGASNFKEAIKIVENCDEDELINKLLEDLSAEYIDGSFKLDVSNDNEESMPYYSVSSVTINKSGDISSDYD